MPAGSACMLNLPCTKCLHEQEKLVAVCGSVLSRSTQKSLLLYQLQVSCSASAQLSTGHQSQERSASRAPLIQLSLGV